MPTVHPFKWRHFEGESILLCARWYLRYALSYRNLEEMMAERGLSVDHTTVYRWVQHYAPALDKRCRPYLKPTTDSYRIDEIYVKVKGQWKYLYRAVDSASNTFDFLLSAKRDAQAAKRFFRKILKASHATPPRVSSVAKNAAYPKACGELQQDDHRPATEPLRPVKYLTKVVEQAHRFIKRRVKPGLGCGSFHTTWRTLRGYEVMHMIRKGQLRGTAKGDLIAQNRLIARVFLNMPNEKIFSANSNLCNQPSLIRETPLL